MFVLEGSDLTRRAATRVRHPFVPAEVHAPVIGVVSRGAERPAGVNDPAALIFVVIAFPIDCEAAVCCGGGILRSARYPSVEMRQLLERPSLTDLSESVPVVAVRIRSRSIITSAFCSIDPYR